MQAQHEYDKELTSLIRNKFAADAKFGRTAQEVDDITNKVCHPLLSTIHNGFTIEVLFGSEQAYIKNTSEYLGEIRSAFDEITNKNIDMVVDFHQVANYVEKYCRAEDLRVSLLSDIARKKGIEYAMREETIYSVMREMFPTKKTYLNHESEAYNALVKCGIMPLLSVGIANVVVPDDEDDSKQAILAIIKAAANDATIYFETVRPFWDEMVREQADKIYKVKKARAAR